jgi:long-chain fatty acid transport protein
VNVRKARSLAAAVAAIATLSMAPRAQGAGLYFSERGVRPLARGGAFVAGADDLHSIWFNPAGLTELKSFTMMVDLAWVNADTSFTRQAAVTDAAGAVQIKQFPTVNGTTPVLPIPTIALGFPVDKEKRWVLAGGVFAPYATLLSYPLTIGDPPTPSPSRYSLVSLDGSLLSTLTANLAFKASDAIRFGAGVQMLVGTFQSSVVFNAAPADRLLSAPEDPNYDALGQIKVGPIFAPSANAGVTIVPTPWLRLGLSGQLPFWINSPANQKTQLPSAAPFDNAKQVGQDAWVKFRLPAILRLGAEVRPVPEARIEAAFVYEAWDLHDTIDVVPTNISLVDVTGFPSPYPVPPITLQRKFKGAPSFRLGGEYQAKFKGYGIDFRLGINYDPSAIPNEWMSPITVDLDRFTVGGGGSLRIGDHWRFDILYARVQGFGGYVDPTVAKMPPVRPVQGNPTSYVATNGGYYGSQANVLGVGVEYKF